MVEVDATLPHWAATWAALGGKASAVALPGHGGWVEAQSRDMSVDVSTTHSSLSGAIVAFTADGDPSGRKLVARLRDLLGEIPLASICDMQEATNMDAAVCLLGKAEWWHTFGGSGVYRDQ